jgi:hypothetical protein
VIPTIRLTRAAICLILIALANSGPTAEPKFSEWTAPVNLGPTINSSFNEFGPATSKDGLSLYFASDRPGGFGSMDIWVAQRPSRNDAWGLPMNLGAVTNTAAAEGPPTLSRDGHWLLFNSNRPGGVGDQDIWAAWREHTGDDLGWEPAFNLGVAVNSAFFDAGPSLLEHDESGAPLLFFTSNRPGLGDPGTFDIYVSQLTRHGLFAPATLVPELNSAIDELRPSLRFDGLEVFFVSNRPGSSGFDVWASTRRTLFSPWAPPANLGPTVNTAFADGQPYIDADRQTLYFVSTRPGGVGGQDLYVSMRLKTHKEGD